MTDTPASELVCECEARNRRAIYELRGMAQQWQIDIPKIIQILTGADGCQHNQAAN